MYENDQNEVVYDRDACITLLTEMSRKLKATGQERYPKRSDFSPEEVNAVKAHFGPWPRALEAAGLKEAKEGGRHQRTVQKRIRAKRRRTREKIERIKERKEKNEKNG